MMRWIIESSMRLRYLVITVAVILLAFGLAQLRDMPVDVFPEFDPPMVEVQTEALGLSATEVESLITVPMEGNLLNGVAWLDRIYSTVGHRAVVHPARLRTRHRSRFVHARWCRSV